MLRKIDPLRSRIMRAVRSKDTGPELVVRKLAHGLGYRFRLHRSDLPGKPDLTFASKRSVIFVHGCFWHGHDCSRGGRVPKNNRDYWINKVSGNRARYERQVADLKASGWKILTVWECEMVNPKKLQTRLRRFLN